MTYNNDYYNINNLKNGKDKKSVINLKTLDILSATKDKSIHSLVESQDVYNKEYGFQIKDRKKQTINIICFKSLLNLINKNTNSKDIYTGIVPDERGNDPIMRFYVYNSSGKKLYNRDIRFEVLSLLAYYQETGYINENICDEMCDIIRRLDDDILSVSTDEFNKFDYIHFDSQYDFRPNNIAIVKTNNAYRLDKECEFLFSMLRDKERFRRIHLKRFEDYCNEEYAEILKAKYGRSDVWVVTQCQNTIRKGSKIYAEVKDNYGNISIISLKIPRLSKAKINIINNKYKDCNFNYLLEVHSLIESILNNNGLKAIKFLARINSKKEDKIVHYKELDIDTLEILDKDVYKPYSNNIINIDIYKEVLGENK